MACGCSQSGVMSGGSPRGVPLTDQKKTELYEKARRYNIKGRSYMTKAQLVDAIRVKQKEIGESIRRRKRR